MSSTGRYSFSRYVKDLFPGEEKASAIFTQPGNRLLTVTWNKYFDILYEFFIISGVINLLTFYTKDNTKISKLRQHREDCIKILKVLIGKTYYFGKPFERITVDTFGKTNIESGILFNDNIPPAPLFRCMKELINSNFIIRFSFKSETGYYYGLSLDNVFKNISYRIKSEVFHYANMRNPDTMTKEDNYENELGLSRFIRNCGNSYLKVYVKGDKFYNKLDVFTSSFDKIVFDSVESAKHFADEKSENILHF